ncbi:MAG: type II secretion system F family protein [Bacilli bacterium]|nr:type II secretion system F family protein [Bacilli bacterium]
MKKNGSLMSRLYRNKTLEQINTKILMLGNAKFDAVTFMNLRLITTILLFIVIIYWGNLSYIYAPFMAIIYYVLFEYLFLNNKLKQREKKLDHEALTFFEILTLTLESGRDLESALEITCFNTKSELSDEFKKTLFEMKFGKSLMEALEDMKSRIPSETVNNIILNIVQTNIFGNSILDTMYNQIEFLRDKQILEIKEKINKIPNKVSIISVVFIVPLILLLLLGPFLIEFIG